MFGKSKFAIAAAALLLTVPAMAQSPSVAPVEGAKTPGSQTTAPQATPKGKKSLPRASEFAAAQAAKISLMDAVATAEAQGGAKAVAADFDARDGGHYEIKTVGVDGKLVEHTIDATTGKITKSENKPFERFFTRIQPSDFHKGGATLKEAVATAEKSALGKAIEVDAELEGKSIQYDVRVVVSGSAKAKEVKIGSDGKVISVK
jgi:uncharacterized membrane protein YkoI